MDGDSGAGGGEIVGFTKPKRLGFIKIKSKPIYHGGAAPVAGGARAEQASQAEGGTAARAEQARASLGASGGARATKTRFSKFDIYLDNLVAKHKDLETQLREVGLKGSPQQFAKRMMTNAILIAVVVGVAMIVMLNAVLATKYANPIVIAVLIGAVIGYAIYTVLFAQFLRYPAARVKKRGKEVERGILFAARDIIISLRSGVPLFNALTSVSTGYGATSVEFAKIINLIQLGTPMDQAIDRVSETSGSRTFKKIMLQASVSIKEGADVVTALQEVVDQAMQERVIELRRYGQRLNALSMFYMLFGVILPSMGIAVLAILTTFINIFSVTDTFLILVLIFIAIIQYVFLNIMKNSRPLFTM